MTITIGLIFLLFSLKVPTIFWIYTIIAYISLGLCNGMRKDYADKKGEKYEEIKDSGMIGIYPLMLMLDSNLDVFAKYGYHHINWIFKTFEFLSWTGIVLVVVFFLIYTVMKMLDK